MTATDTSWGRKKNNCTAAIMTRTSGGVLLFVVVVVASVPPCPERKVCTQSEQHELAQPETVLGHVLCMLRRIYVSTLH